MDLTYIISTLVAVFSIIISLTLTEAAKGFVALYFGDNTIKIENRDTFNPLAHIDLIGTILLPGFLILSGSHLIIGWPKRLHINFSRFTKWGGVAVHAASPLAHIIIAIIAAALIHFNPNQMTLGNELMIDLVGANISFAALNLLPLPPLSGGMLIAAILPKKLSDAYLKMQPYTFIIVMCIILLPKALGPIGASFDPIKYTIMPIRFVLQKLVLLASGHW